MRRNPRDRFEKVEVFVVIFMGCVQGKSCSGCCRGWTSGTTSSAGSPGSGRGASAAAAASATSDAGPLGKHVLTGSTVGSAVVPSRGLLLQYSSLSERGHYPDTPDRENQDAFCIKTNFQGNPNLHFFGVFDGHGQFGAQCAIFVRDKLVDLLSADPQLADDPVKAYSSAFVSVNSLLHESEIDDSLSGTTAITVLVSGDSLFVANVGDSRAVAAVYNGFCLVAEDLSHDQTPFRKDEYERVKLCGARVLSVDQVEGIKDPGIQSWGDEEDDEGDPPRLWVQNAMYPGTAFTRSVGDSTAESIGVIAAPEVMQVKITPTHQFFIIASDGVFEFLSSQTVVDMVARFKDPRDACATVSAESYKMWLAHESRTDDITVLVVQIKFLSNPPSVASSETTEMIMKTSVYSEKARAERYISYGTEVHDVAVERSSACVAPSPVQPMSSEA
ncbi:putative protein phosphatase 2C 35 [Apostasia shenzhenica]|uniref:protein-serine/threonine phosphatase n=1 Tax=Apostasia shenzhenica TaxID=1088818 RepID=A0A2I0AZD4_9ASPA|nr:putative protein phosphatase 2C 35 [Apostasia shenzhenica]